MDMHPSDQSTRQCTAFTVLGKEPDMTDGTSWLDVTGERVQQLTAVHQHLPQTKYS